MSLWRKKMRKVSNRKFRRLTGVDKRMFAFLVSILRPKWNELRKLGGDVPKLSLEDQILLTLSYWRNYGTYLETGAKFDVSESTAFRVCRWVEDHLKTDTRLHLPGKKSLLDNNTPFDIVIVDATESPIERPKRRKRGRRRNRQTKFYSGKKKRHTIKHQLVIDSRERKIIATAMESGSTHDFKIYKKSKTHVHPETKIQGDSGYQGIQKIHSHSETPKKKTKQQPLSKDDKRSNRALSQKRIAVEHVLGCIKKFKIIGDRYRNRHKRFGLRFNLICAIYNIEKCGEL